MVIFEEKIDEKIRTGSFEYVGRDFFSIYAIKEMGYKKYAKQNF